MFQNLFSAFAVVLFTATSSSSSGDYSAGDLIIDRAFAFETTATARAAAGYLTVRNTGDTPDRLIGVEAGFPRVMIHTTEEKDGIARMMHVEAIAIPAGEAVELTPGGLHVMFMGLGGDPFEAGEAVPATLIFENAGRVEVVFTVVSRDAAPAAGADHSGHGQ